MNIYKRPNSKFYWFKFTFDGKLIQQSTKVSNKKDAEIIASAYRTQLALGKIGIKPKRNALTFEQTANDFLKWSKVSHAEQATERREFFAVQVLIKFFGKRKTDAIETADVENFVLWRSRQISRKTGEAVTRGTINRELITLKRIFKRLVNDETLSKNPAETVKLLKENDAEFHVITQSEEKMYLLACPRQLQDVAILMLETGMRCGEVYRIRRAEVFLDKGFLKVTKGKTKSAIRQIHLSERAKAVLRSRLRTFKGEYLFPQNDVDFRRPTATLDKMHTRTIAKLKMNFRLYDCRHTFATRAVESGIDLLTLSQILGHSGLKTVSRYAHPSESFKADAIKKMNSSKRLKIV